MKKIKVLFVPMISEYTVDYDCDLYIFDDSKKMREELNKWGLAKYELYKQQYTYLREIICAVLFIDDEKEGKEFVVIKGKYQPTHITSLIKSIVVNNEGVKKYIHKR